MWRKMARWCWRSEVSVAELGGDGRKATESQKTGRLQAKCAGLNVALAGELPVFNCCWKSSRYLCYIAIIYRRCDEAQCDVLASRLFQSLIAWTCSSCWDQHVHLEQHEQHSSAVWSPNKQTAATASSRRLPLHRHCGRDTAPPADGRQPDHLKPRRRWLYGSLHPSRLSPLPRSFTACQGDLHPAPPSPSPTASTWHGDELPGHSAPPRRIKT